MRSIGTRRWRGALISAVVAAAALMGPAAAGAVTPGALGHEGRWITDGQGRVVVLHGFNMVNKTAPFHATALGFGSDDAQFLRRNGFNAIRLGVSWEAVEPEPGRYDDEYVDRIAAEIEMLAAHNIYTLLDFHQDQYARPFQGNGFPEWAIIDDGLAREPRSGFPLNYYRMPALQRAFDNFWENEVGPGGVGIQDRYAAAWRHVVGRVHRLRGILGYDVMNEPWPGSRLDCSSWEGCRDFDRGPFAAFHERVFAAIRQVDGRHLIWHEPLLPFDYGAPTFTKDTGDDKAGFSFHMYCFGAPGFAGGEVRSCDDVNPTIFEQAEAVSERTGDALLLTEFGANIGTPQSIVDATELADRFEVGWLEWQYDDPYSDSLSQSLVADSSLPPAGYNIDPDKLELLSRPYPQLVAGTPRGWSYDPETKRFGLRYRTRGVAGERLAGKLRTRVFIPPVAYPAGYRARVVGGRIVSAPNSPRLRIAAKRSARRVGLKVTPRLP